MSKDTAVATKDEAQVPDLVRTPALEITAEDVVLPRIKIGQFMTAQVQEGTVTAGDIFASASEDDADVLAKVGDKEGVVIHVLALRKGKSASIDGDLVLYDFDDPDAPADAWTTYNYHLALPTVDDEVPYKLLLTKTGTPAARQINTVLKKNERRGPAWNTAFRLTSAQRENAKGKYFVPRVAVVDAEAAHVEAAAALGALLLDAPQPAASGSSSVAI